MTLDGSEKMTISASFLGRIHLHSSGLICLIVGISWVQFAEQLSQGRRGWPVLLEIFFGYFLSACGLYLLYKTLKNLGSNMPRLELSAKEISVFYSAIKFERYEWKDVEEFFSVKRPTVFGLNNDCVALRLKHSPNGANWIELPAGLDQSAPRLAGFLNSQRLKFGSEQNQENG